MVCFFLSSLKTVFFISVDPYAYDMDLCDDEVLLVSVFCLFKIVLGKAVTPENNQLCKVQNGHAQEKKSLFHDNRHEC